MPITVYIDSDPASLGADADQADLDAYATNLAAHLSKRFGADVEVELVLGGSRGGRQCSDDSIEEYVRELQGGDGWLELLGSAEPGAEPTPEWTYEGYWNAVLGAYRDAHGVVAEFDLAGATERNLDEWLGGCESDAWAMSGRKQDDMPEAWRGFHRRALEELVAATESTDD